MQIRETCNSRLLMTVAASVAKTSEDENFNVRVAFNRTVYSQHKMM